MQSTLLLRLFTTICMVALITISALTSHAQETSPEKLRNTADIMHHDLFAKDQFPSAEECATCHERQYRQWSVSPHAYAQLSPTNATQNLALIAHFNGTIGDFCARCHTPVGMTLGEDPRLSNLDRAQAAVEGVTCIVCHRANNNWGVNSDARFFINEGDIHAPVYGTSDPERFKNLLPDNKLKLAPEPKTPGRPVHAEVRQYKTLADPKFCMQCHGVHLLNDANVQKTPFEYKNSPAAQKGISCVDCHMGKTPGVADGYDVGPAAVVGGVPTPERKLINHHNAGPDSSIVHPGLFPFNPAAKRMATPREWLTFNVESGWGTDAFEDNAPEDYVFPEKWEDIDDRYDARDIIEQNLELLEWARKRRLTLWKNGFRMDDITLKETSMKKGIAFAIRLWNGSEGHSVPSGFAMDRPVWLQVSVTDPEGRIIFSSGDRDPNGDYRDDLSLYVRHGKLELDDQLFTLNSMFMLPAKRGSHHNQPLPIGFSANTLQFARPEATPANVLGDPAGLRFHRRSIETGGERWAKYRVAKDILTVPGTYQIRAKLIAQALPVYFIKSIAFAGFDYNMSPRDVADKIVEHAETLWEKTLQIEVK